MWSSLGLRHEALALHQLKQKLAAENIFAAERKRPLPRFPRRIGVVTSKNGAAIHDIIRTVQRRLTATENEVTAEPLGVYRISGSRPTLPMTMTLFRPPGMARCPVG